MSTLLEFTKAGLFAALALALAVAFTNIGSTEAVADGHGDRSQAMKSMAGAMKNLGGAVGSGNAAEAQTLALPVSAIAAQIPDLFEGGSPSEASRAKAEIWDNWDDFVAKAASLQAAADVVAADASAGALGSDPKAVVGSIGATCGACHKAYRGPEKN